MRNRYCMLVSAVFFVSLFAPSGFAQALNFGNNFFVSGDYVVGGVGLQGSGVNGYATGTITIPDKNPGISGATSVPAGAQVVAALLYWETVEKSSTTFAGQQGFFRPVFAGGPSSGYPITGVPLGNPNAPVSWSLGGCSIPLPGAYTMRAYRADVRAFLPQDPNGNVLANGSYEVRLADSGSNAAPQTLGASLVIIYRILSPAIPLNSVVIYDGAFAPSVPTPFMTQKMQGFYQAAATPVTKLTHIVGNGQPYKYETVFLNKTLLPSLYGNQPSFPGYYKGAWGQGAWDNPTWSFPNANYLNGTNPVSANDAAATTSVVPGVLSGCVSHGAVILSTTVQNTDNDGLLDVWKQNQGYCDVAVNPGACGGAADPSWVALPGAMPGQKDVFIQLDYMCSVVNPDGSCNTNTGTSYQPNAQAVTNMTNAFALKGITLQILPTNVIPEQTCTDSPPTLCTYPNQPGVVGWLAGFAFLKNQPLNYKDEASCEAAGPACQRRFQRGRKDSYHYVMFANALGGPGWTLQDGSLTSVVASGNTVTFTTSTPHGLVVDSVNGNGRVTVADAITPLPTAACAASPQTCPSLNGTYLVQSVANPTTFTIGIATAVSATTSYTHSTDPNLSIASGQAGTGSGRSDVGGENSLITLGLWGADGLTVPVQSGTFMHELGHTFALTHGGFYFDNLANNDYTPTIEANCKPNFQSVMNYLFQVDLLDNGALDYSEEQLVALDENVKTSSSPFPNSHFPTTSWYVPFSGVGTPAKAHCDGTAILNGAQMSRMTGPTSSLSWSAGQDINFDGKHETITNTAPFTYGLRGYNDWLNLDLRQISASGTNSVAGVGFAGGGGGVGFGGGGGGVGNGEITLFTANSVVRPPRNLTAALTPANAILLNWMAPSFGTLSAYKIYRGVNGGTPSFYTTVSGVPGSPPPTTYTDQQVGCATYTYFVTAVLAMDGSEGIPSNTTASVTVPCIFTGFLSPLAAAGDSSYSGKFEDDVIPIVWQIQGAGGTYLSDLTLNTVGEYYTPLPKGGKCPLPLPPVGNYKLTLLYSNGVVVPGKVKPYNTFTYNAKTNQFVFKWDSEGFATPGCYLIEVDLPDGTAHRTSLLLYEQ